MMEAVHRRLAHGLLECGFLSERQACDLVFQDARRRPPSAFQMVANEMARLRKLLAEHGITLPRASSNKGYYLPADEKEKLRAVLKIPCGRILG
jgi:hypothetical protein